MFEGLEGLKIVRLVKEEVRERCHGDKRIGE